MVTGQPECISHLFIVLLPAVVIRLSLKTTNREAICSVQSKKTINKQMKNQHLKKKREKVCFVATLTEYSALFFKETL